uniref:Uncharacterized protein n=1 Tax=Arundo donax TaxID=35708 RepID=A0A0A9A2E1_ARUDO
MLGTVNTDIIQLLIELTFLYH